MWGVALYSIGMAGTSPAMTGEGHRETASQDEGCGVLQFPRVITGLVPVIPIRRAPRLSDRDGRDRPGHDGRGTQRPEPVDNVPRLFLTRMLI